jgi:hypothetical protein
VKHSLAHFYRAARTACLSSAIALFPVRTLMLLAQRFNPAASPEASRFAANLAGAKRFLLGDFDTLVNSITRMVNVDAQSGKLLFDLEDLKLVTGCVFELFDQGFQVLA